MPRSKGKSISQSEIAAELGCSQALVSMALNGRTKGISSKTYRLIRELAIKHGYQPKGMQPDESIDSLQARTVGYILRSPLKLANKSNFFSHVHNGLHERLNQERIKTIYLGSEDDLSGDDVPLAAHIPSSIMGLVVMGEVDPRFLAKVRETGLPIVYVSARDPGYCHSVVSNERQSAELLTQHLTDLGHSSFAWLGGGKPLGRQEERLASLRATLASRELKLDACAIVPDGGSDRKEGYEAARRVRQAAARRSLPTAWICFNALMARGAIAYLLQHGFAVGKDVSIAALDMTLICEEEHPSITSAGADPEEMGRQAGRLVEQAAQETDFPLTDLIVPAQFVARESSGPFVSRRKKAKAAS